MSCKYFLDNVMAAGFNLILDWIQVPRATWRTERGSAAFQPQGLVLLHLKVRLPGNTRRSVSCVIRSRLIATIANFLARDLSSASYRNACRLYCHWLPKSRCRTVAPLGAAPPGLTFEVAAALPPRRFEIPAGVLHDAAQLFRKVTSLEISMTNEGIGQLATNGVSGVLTPEQALDRMLRVPECIGVSPARLPSCWN